jgi:hypothetical protein
MYFFISTTSGSYYAKVKIIEQLNNISKSASTLVFQMGFNWHGNTKTCLFKDGTKREMIDYIAEGTKNNWEILSIGIPERLDNGQIVYREMNEINIPRADSLGEFLNRPLFIMKSI